MAPGARCMRVVLLSGHEYELDAPERWQAVLDRAARIRRLRDFEDATGLYKVVDRDDVTTLFVVEE